ncbi:MAG: repressor LexA [Sphingobacteriales bacterium]|nr:repressor LexA [Sphingobacteriales bacterium]
MPIDLDEKDKRAYSLIRNKLLYEGKKPTLREINAVTGGRSPRSASLVIDRLIRMGLLRKTGKTLKLAETPSLNTTSISTISIPLVGSVACGLPILARENIETFIPVSTAIAKKGSQYFLLRACGDSMNEAGINDGDILLVRQQNYADNGRKVVALIDDEATVKILDRRQNVVILRPKSSNSKHKPIIVTEDCQIQGEVISVLPKDIF